jgi:hypothetical protein
MHNTSQMTCFVSEQLTLSRANFASFMSFSERQRSFGSGAFSSAQGSVISCLFNSVPVEHHEYDCSMMQCSPSAAPDVQKSLETLTFAANSHAMLVFYILDNFILQT